MIKPGIGFDTFLVCGMLGFVLRREHLKPASVRLFRNPIMTWTLILYVYTCVELFNPLAHSFDGWYDSFRKATEDFVLLFVAYFVLTSWKRIDKYLYALFWASFLVGLYGCIQQWHGLFPFEMAQVLKIKDGTASIWFGGQIRKFSTVSSPTGFGMDMAATATIFIILGLNEARKSRRWLYFLGSIPMILGMTYSGTRTSTIMLVAGLGLYVLLHLDKKETRIFAVLAFLCLLFVIKLPYYGNATLNRFRSSFEGKSDDSYLVREVNRKRIQPYILTHPIGGGLGTTNNAGIKWNPGHYLAGFQTDNGHLKIALEMGSIGLLITLILLFLILKGGVHEFFRTKDPWQQAVIAACTASLFSFTLGDLAQEGIGEITNLAIFYPCIAIILRAAAFNDKSGYE
ncbi:MAG TPA: O-antigen ligase family protein [Puia sp.]